MGIFKRLIAMFSSESFADQISARGFADLLGSAFQHKTEVLAFQEASHQTALGDEWFLPNLLAEFRNPKLGIIHGEGGGHAFIRVPYLQKIVRENPGRIPNYKTLVALFRENGYEVKRVDYVSFRRGRGALGGS